MTAWSAHMILCKLKDRLEKEGWVVLPEVRTKDGHRDRYADAIAVNLWSSRGYEIAGYEFKSSRSDFLNEMRDSSKSDAAFRRCDRWFLVLGDKSIASLDEIPAAWGVMAPRGDSLVVLRQAVKLEPIPVDRELLTSLLRRAKEWQRPDEQTKIMIAKAVDEDRKYHNHFQEQKIARIESEAFHAKEAIKKFYVTAGVMLSDHNATDIATKFKRGQVALTLRSKLEQSAHLLRRCAKEAEETAQVFDEATACAKEIQVNSEEAKMSDGMGI